MGAARVTIRFEKPRLYLAGSKLTVSLNTQLVFQGDFTDGFEETLEVAPGTHQVNTRVEIGIVRTRSVPVAVEAGRHTLISLEYSRFWGNFTKKPRVFVE
ncbi:MAG: hypothetical protein R3B07_02580 [Polyangiaceae bacterium]